MIRGIGPLSGNLAKRRRGHEIESRSWRSHAVMCGMPCDEYSSSYSVTGPRALALHAKRRSVPGFACLVRDDCAASHFTRPIFQPVTRLRLAGQRTAAVRSLIDTGRRYLSFSSARTVLNLLYQIDPPANGQISAQRLCATRT
jgi:hypothetical protein